MCETRNTNVEFFLKRKKIKTERENAGASEGDPTKAPRRWTAAPAARAPRVLRLRRRLAVRLSWAGAWAGDRASLGLTGTSGGACRVLTGLCPVLACSGPGRDEHGESPHHQRGASRWVSRAATPRCAPDPPPPPATVLPPRPHWPRAVGRPGSFMSRGFRRGGGLCTRRR